jgi:hypothetical protein
MLGRDNSLVVGSPSLLRAPSVYKHEERGDDTNLFSDEPAREVDEVVKIPSIDSLMNRMGNLTGSLENNGHVSVAQLSTTIVEWVKHSKVDPNFMDGTLKPFLQDLIRSLHHSGAEEVFCEEQEDVEHFSIIKDLETEVADLKGKLKDLQT